MRTLMFIVALIVCCTAAIGMGGGHPAGNVADRGEWPSGLAELINSRPRVGSYWVNANDFFLYSGDTAAFQAFLNGYSKLPQSDLVSVDGVVHTLPEPRPEAGPLTLILRSGDVMREALGDPVNADWTLAFRKWGANKESKGNPLALELNIGGRVRFADVKVPGNVEIVQGESYVTRDVEVGKVIPLELSCGAGDEAGTVQMKSITLVSEKKSCTASISASVVSYPKGKWTVTISFHDKNWREIGSGKATFENSGMVAGVPAIRHGELIIDLGKSLDFDAGERFRLYIRPASSSEETNAEIVSD